MYYNKVGGDAFVALLGNNEKVSLGHLRFLLVSSDSAASEQIAQRLKNMEIDKDLLSHLVDMAKSSPRGNRYIATRVDVQVLAQDDTTAAVSGLSFGDYVITTSSKPLEAGMQVNMVEN